MKTTEFQVRPANKKEIYTRSAKINDRDVSINIELVMNELKGTFTILPKLTSQHFTGKAINDKATLKVVADLSYEALKKAHDWQDEWYANKQADDANQGKLGDDGFDEEE
jgi:hypothetical protein